MTLTSVVGISNIQGDNVTGTLAISDWDGDDIVEDFVGIYSFNSTANAWELNIENASSYDSTTFDFDFQIESNGTIYAARAPVANFYALTGGFFVDDTSNDTYQANEPSDQDYVQMD